MFETRNQLLHSFHYAALLAAVAISTGCNRSPYVLAPVHGTVTVDDQPLFQGKVRFAPVAKGDDNHPGRPALGSIQSDGTYRLTTYKGNDGAVIGEHWVMITNVEEELPDGVPEFARLTMPKKVTVVEGKDNRIDIKLTSDAIRELREDDT